MRKILTIALREYRAMVGTKAFIISIVMMPILMFAGIVAMEVFKDVGQTRQRTIAVIDHSGEFIEALQLAAEARAQALLNATQTGTSVSIVDAQNPVVSAEVYVIKDLSDEPVDDAVRFQLSEQIRQQELYAFVEIPAEILAIEDQGQEQSHRSVQFYAQDSSISLARRWVAEIISQVAKEKRLGQSGLQPQQIATFRRYDRSVAVAGRGLMHRNVDGSFVSSEEKDALLTLFLPLGIMMMMFMVIFMASQPMLESVLEEKSQRIAEVLLGSANPFQLMMGKLIGTVAGSLTIFSIYLLGTYSVSIYHGWAGNIPVEILPWFIVFQIIGVLFYAAIFMAVGASVSQLKEAQSLLLPVWMLLMAPLFVWFLIVRDPQGPLAVTMSLFPATAPTTMVLRLATGQTIPTWQPIAATVMTVLATIVVVVIAGRIFRVGILWQGKTPRLAEILKWALVGE